MITNPFDNGSEYFDRAAKFYSSAVLDLFTSNNSEQKQREIAQKIAAWRDEWSRAGKWQYLPLTTAVELMVAHLTDK